jgi:hypothetical protein
VIERRSGLFRAYRAVALNDAAAPPFPAHEADEEDDAPDHEGLDVEWERARASWAPIDPADVCDDAPVRFIDGSIATKTAGAIEVGGRLRPIIAASMSAAALVMEGRSLHRDGTARTRKAICLYSDGIDPPALSEASDTLRALDTELLLRPAEAARDFDTMRRATRSLAMEAMESDEQRVLLEGKSVPTLVDGLLERRLAGVGDHAFPVVGLVKRQMQTYLPGELQDVCYRLRPGQRTPAFVLRTVQHVDLVNVYLRLSAPAGASPSYGIVRVTAPLPYVERAHAGARAQRFLSGLAGYLYRLRHRDYGYARAGISVEPIVRVEDHLHAILPNVDVLVAKLHRLLGREASEGSAA